MSHTGVAAAMNQRHHVFPSGEMMEFVHGKWRRVKWRFWKEEESVKA